MNIARSEESTTDFSALERHPQGLYVCFATEMWERFGFYTVSAMLALYLRDNVRGLGWPEPKVASLVSYYLMFVYASPLAGGWFADKFVGYKVAIAVGGIFLSTGYFLLYWPSVFGLYLGLTCVVIGNGLFKPSVSTLVGNLYPDGSKLKDSAYNIFYMGINIGAFLAPLVAEFVQHRLGFRIAFTGAGFGMVLGLLIFAAFRKWVDVKGSITEKTRPTETKIEDSRQKGEIHEVPESKRVLALVGIFSIVIVFWMLFHQNTLTLIYFANDHTDWSAIGEVSGILSAAINPFWVVTLTFPLVSFWGWLDRRGKQPSTPAKMAIGMSLIACAFYLMSLASLHGGNEGRVSPMWLISAYAIASVGELMLSPMGLSLVSKVAPVRMRGVMMGGWFVAIAIGNKLTAIGAYWSVWSHSTFFAILATFALGMSLLLWALLKPLKKAMPGV